MACKGQIAEQNANEHVLAIAPQGNLQLSPIFFWNFSHPIRMFLTLRQGFLTIFWIFQTGLVPNDFFFSFFNFTYFRPPSRMAVSRSYPRHLVKFCEERSIKRPLFSFTSSVALVAMSQGLPKVTTAYRTLPQVTAGYRRLLQVTAGYYFNRFP